MSRMHRDRIKQGSELVGKLNALKEIIEFVEDIASRAKVVNIKIIQDKLGSMTKECVKELEEFSKNA